MQTAIPQNELIDTQWNVNSVESVTVAPAEFELIDTQWNVNYPMQLSELILTKELIDTQWNVNSYAIHIDGGGAGN